VSSVNNSVFSRRKPTSKSMELILASGSPRRRELLRSVGLKFRVLVPECDETPRKGESPAEMVKRLSAVKALAVRSRLARSNKLRVILAADTTVVTPDGRRILGKPRNEAEARKMVAEIAGRTHVVLTGYTIVIENGARTDRISRVIRSYVTMRKLDRDGVRAYVATGESMDKAGAYAAQGFGMGFIESLQGSYTNVVGLPISHVLEDLERVAGLLPFGRGKLKK
jgi:septum formation protein